LGSVSCPYCGAPVSYGSGDVVTTCPYCGTTFAIGGRPLEKHLMGRVNYSPSEAYAFFKEWALRKPETPNDLPVKARIASHELTYYPFWVYRVSTRLKYEGRAERSKASGIEEERVVVAVPAHSSMYGTPLEFYNFSLRGKVFFDASYASRVGAKLLQANIAEDKAWSEAWRRVINAIEGKLRSRGLRYLKLDVESYSVDGPYYVHVPIYTVTYKYGSKTYRFMSDASDNRVIYSEIPIGVGFRALALSAAVVSAIAAFALLSLGLSLKMPVFGGMSFLLLLAVAAYSAYRGLRERLVVKTVARETREEAPELSFLYSIAVRTGGAEIE